MYFIFQLLVSLIVILLFACNNSLRLFTGYLILILKYIRFISKIKVSKNKLDLFKTTISILYSTLTSKNMFKNKL